MSDSTVAILEILAERPRASRTQLAEATGLSAATVGRVVDRLRRRGVLREYSIDATGVGRPPRLVELDDDSAFVIGVDAGGRTLRAALADLQGTIRGRLARPTRDPSDRNAVVGDLVALIEDLAVTVRPGTVLAVVAGISGIVDHDAGRVLLSPDLPGLDGFDLAAALEARIERPVAIDNDDLLAAIGEATAGAAVGCRDVVFLSLGYGLGAGLIVGGRPIRGASHAAGAIAYMSPGRLEDRASGRAIPARFREALARRSVRVDPDADDRPMVTVGDARTVFGLAAAGDATAVRVIGEVVAELGDLAIDVAALLDPQVIVVGGGLAQAGPALFGPLAERLAGALPYPPRLAASALQDAAVLHGASSLALVLARRRLAGLGPPPRLRSDPERTTLQLV
jgi:predicted NBD/HSP70 family sugar kinase